MLILSDLIVHKVQRGLGVPFLLFELKLNLFKSGRDLLYRVFLLCKSRLDQHRVGAVPPVARLLITDLVNGPWRLLDCFPEGQGLSSLDGSCLDLELVAAVLLVLMDFVWRAVVGFIC